MAGKRRSGRQKPSGSKRQGTPQVSDEETPPKKGKKSSSDFCREFDVQDVDLEYTDADYKNLTTFNLFVRLIRPQISSANPKFIPASKMNQIMDAKWREFQNSNPFINGGAGKEDEDEEQGDDDDDDDDEEVDDEDGMAQEKEIRDVDDEDDDDDDKTEEENQSTEEYDKTQSSDGNESGPSHKDRNRSAKKSQSHKKDPIKATRESGLKIRLSGLAGFGVRKSARERKPITKDSRYGEYVASGEEDSEASGRARRRMKRKASEDEPSEEDARPKRSLRGGKAKLISDDEDEDSDTPRRRSGRNSRVSSRPESGANKRRKQESESDATQETQSSSESSSSESDSDSSSDGSSSSPSTRLRTRKRVTKKKPERLSIPGERKSERSRKAAEKLKDMTDRDFERMLQEEEKEKKRVNSAKEKRRRQKVVDKFKLKQNQKKGKWQDDGDDIKSGEESDHFWYCYMCKDGGDLILCDGCPKSYHKKCLKIEDDLSEGEWKCPLCLGKELPEVSEEEDGAHDHFCKECKEGGDLLLCDFCPLAFHMRCLNPSLKEIPEGDWKCTRCMMAEKPLKNVIKKILTWRWVNTGNLEDELDHTSSPRKRSMSMSQQDKEEDEGLRPSREFFVVYKYHSFWDCEFIPELQVDVHQRQMMISFMRKFDLDEPPMVDDLASRKHKDNDPHNLVERYYKWGVKPDWLQIHRILTHERERGGKAKMYKYLVKWRDRPYEDATWEAEDDLPEGLQDWDKQVKAYWTHRKEKEGGGDSKKKETKKPRKKDLKIKLEKQPPYIEKSGGKLHPYQLEGLNWMRFSFAQDTNVILADEMGLGKTIQAISFIFSLWKEGHTPGPFLITAPLSTVTNWEREFEFWAPEMYLLTYVGGKDSRAILREREFSYREDSMMYYTKPCKMRSSHLPPKFDVLLTSYEYPSMDTTLLSSIPWSVLVIDEAHRLKNNQSLFFRVLSNYKVDYRLLLTGTPLQNNLEELFNLLNFLEPGKFLDMALFLEEFATIGKEEQVARLHEMLAPHMLRRLKMDVLKEIPDKMEFIIRVELSAMQKKYYKHILTKNYHALNVKGYGHGTSLINIMMDLRKCCNHPYLFPSAIQDAEVTKTGAYEGKALIAGSGKLILLEKMLKELHATKHRVLIFSQMTRMIDLLEDFLEHVQLPYERIDGNVMGAVRQERIDRFNDPESKSFVFLLSTKAGGLGINLATADTVIIYDQDWNPHNDIQAFSRAHRIGQKNKVMIYRFVCRASVEEKITQTCKEKLMLSELVIAKRGGPAANTDSLSKQEVNDILKFGAEDLFKEDKDGESKVVTYDEEAVKKMLDRSQQGEKEVEKSFGMNEYLRSFKVATYMVKDVEEAEVIEEEEEEKEEELSKLAPVEEKDEKNENETEYWQRVLGDAYAEHLQQLEAEQAEIQKSLGKGKRVRKRINYAETALMELMTEKEKKKMLRVEVLAEDADHDQEYFSDYKPDDSASDSEPEDDKDDEDYQERECLTAEERAVLDRTQREKQEQEKIQKQGTYIEKKRKDYEKAQQVKLAEEALPPLLAKVNNNIEVLGFTARQRRVFLDTVMRFGIPPEDVYQSLWLVRDLRGKTERVFKAYVALFMRHLCEPVADKAEKFADGVPVEGLSRHHVLTRIGMIALIKRKVLEYEDANGVDSMDVLLKKAKIIQEEKAKKHAELLKAQEERQRQVLLELDKQLTLPNAPPQQLDEEQQQPDDDDKLAHMETEEDSETVSLQKAEEEKQRKILHELIAETDAIIIPDTPKKKENKDEEENNERTENVENEKEDEIVNNDNEKDDDVDTPTKDSSETDTADKKLRDEKENGENETETAEEKGSGENETETAEEKESVENETETAEEKESGENETESGEIEREELMDTHEVDTSDTNKESDKMQTGGYDSICDDIDSSQDCSEVEKVDYESKESEVESKESEVESTEIGAEPAQVSQLDGANDSESDDEANGEKDSIKEDNVESTNDQNIEASSEEHNTQSAENSPEKDSKSSENSPEKDSKSSESSPEKDSKSSENSPEKDSKPSENSPEKESKSSVESPEKDSKLSENSPEKDSKSSENLPEKDSKLSENSPEKDSKSSENSPEKDSKSSDNTPEKDSPTKDDESNMDTNESTSEVKEVEEMDTSEPTTLKDSDVEKIIIEESTESTKSDVEKERVEESTESKTSEMEEDPSSDKEDVSEGKKKVIDKKVAKEKNIDSDDEDDVEEVESSDDDESESDDEPEVIELDESEEPPQKAKASTNETSDKKAVTITDDSSKASSDQEAEKKNPPKVVVVQKPLTEVELRQERMRKIFWVADGGFTELHAVWNHEEGMVIEGREWTMWHRRHDFWLLAGVITHGYRHWQEILSDPRFEILNKAFRFDADRMRRAAFLNRRFQLLEQALVIEEQLRKAARENKAHFEAAKEELEEMKGEDVTDPLVHLDQFACNLRKISHGQKVRGPAPDSNVHKAISGLSNLITDIRQITYKTMPSTLAMTEHGAQTSVTKPATGRGKVIKID